MFEPTDTPEAPWIVIRSDGKKRARLNCMRHVLHMLPYADKDKKIAVKPDPEIVGVPAKMHKSYKKK
ncbi:MAG: hypothetical protein GY862_28160 [Gammaproteobacteria bacterium]|nr:hypothetical protein [Gammaproteobacteria bacterium]